MSIPNLEIPNQKCSEIENYLSTDMMPRVLNSILGKFVSCIKLLKNILIKLTLVCVQGICGTKINFILNMCAIHHVAHCVYANISNSEKNPNLKNIWSQAFQTRCSQLVQAKYLLGTNQGTYLKRIDKQHI